MNGELKVGARIIYRVIPKNSIYPSLVEGRIIEIVKDGQLVRVGASDGFFWIPRHELERYVEYVFPDGDAQP